MDRPARTLLRGAMLLVLAPLVAACQIEVPIPPSGTAPAPSASAGSAAPPSSAAVAELPPLPRAKIVGEDMTFKRGGYIEEADMVAFSDGISRADGWKQTKLLVNGESVYVSEAGCTVSLRYTAAQAPLVVDGDDQASTEALFRFMDPSILPEYLVPTSWLWGETPGDATASIEFLTYIQNATKETPATALSLRLFHATRTGLAFTVSCPTDDGLTDAIADIRSRVSVVPPG